MFNIGSNMFYVDQITLKEHENTDIATQVWELRNALIEDLSMIIK